MSDLNIEIAATDVTDQKFFFQEVGAGQFKGEPIKIMTAPPAADPIIMYKGRKYIVPLANLAAAICEKVDKDD